MVRRWKIGLRPTGTFDAESMVAERDPSLQQTNEASVAVTNDARVNEARRVPVQSDGGVGSLQMSLSQPRVMRQHWPNA